MGGGGRARVGSVVSGSAAAAACALGVVTNYATAAVPDWAARPAVVWPVFGVLAVGSLVLGLIGRRLDAAEGGHPGRLVSLGRVLAGGMSSLRAPHGSGAVRGRAGELDALRQLSARPQGRYAVVCGVGGIGKTTLAAALADIARAEGRPVFWIRHNDADDLAEQMTRTALACGLPESKLEDARTGRAGLPDVVWGHLETTGRWLLVLDGVDDPLSVGPNGEDVAGYRGWIRPATKGLVLVTSRNTDPEVWGRLAVLHRVTPLDAEAGGQVLRDLAPHAGTVDEARALAARLGGLPLALHAAGRYLSAAGSRHHTLAAYTAALDTQMSTLLGAEHPQAGDPEVARTVVRHTWELSLDQLTAAGLPLVRPVLTLLALLAPAPVPSSLLTPDLVTEATGQPAGPSEVEAALNGLHTYGLIDTPLGDDGRPALGQVLLHSLVREITAHAHTAAAPVPDPYRRALVGRLGQTVAELTRAGRSGWSAAVLLAPHLVTAAGFPHDQGDGLRHALGSLSGHLSDAGAYGAAAHLSQAEFTVTARLRGPDHPHTLNSGNNLANALNDLGRHREAVDLHRTTLAAYERVLGPDHPHALNSRNNLANALNDLGRHHEAADLHRETLTAYERVLGPDHALSLNSRGNLAHALGGLGRLHEAVALEQQILGTRDRLLGPDHADTLSIASNLAVTLSCLAQHQQAAELHRRTLATRERLLGPDHPHSLTSRSNLANTLDQLGEHQEAADLHQDTLATRERVLGPDHPHSLTSRSNLAVALFNLGRYREAADLHHRTLTARERLLGPDHPHTLTSRSKVAASIYSLGRHQEAAELQQRTLTALERLLGPDHPYTLAGGNDLAVSLDALGRHRDAAELHRSTLTARERLLGPDHPDTAASRDNLAAALSHASGRPGGIGGLGRTLRAAFQRRRPG